MLRQVELVTCESINQGGIEERGRGEVGAMDGVISGGSTWELEGG